jgi:nitric oxide reductase NorE protein
MMPAQIDSGWGPLSRLPGHPLMWVLIASELLVFGIALVGYAAARVADPASFATAQAELDRVAGTINTAVLVTSGFCAARAGLAAGEGARTGARLWLAAAAILGIVFLMVKAREYGVELDNGHGLDSGGFFTLYFLVTGFHALHVIAGLIVLVLLMVWPDPDHVSTGTAFWHMVDLVWLVVFPCLYLLR